MLAERLMVGSEFGRFENRLGGLRLVDGGHVEDDESNLIYMWARYYDPTSGRFLSEDPQMQGLTWFSYCNSDPVNNCDQTGRESVSLGNWSDLFLVLVGIALSFWKPKSPQEKCVKEIISDVTALVAAVRLTIKFAVMGCADDAGWELSAACGILASVDSVILFSACEQISLLIMLNEDDGSDPAFTEGLDNNAGAFIYLPGW